MTEACDVVVVGAGPAGSAAAITLADAGYDVTLVDKATFPRDKCCGDGLTTLALRELEAIGLDPRDLASWVAVDAAWVRSPSGRTVELPLPQGEGTFAGVVPRVELDASLVGLAHDRGVRVLEGHAVTGLDLSRPGTLGLHVAGVGTLRTQYAIAADGMWSPMRRFTAPPHPPHDGGRGPDLGEWHAFRQYASGVSEAAATQLWIWFEPDLLPGYAWSFPIGGGRANVGFGVLRAQHWTGRAMAAAWQDLLGRPHVQALLGQRATWDGTRRAWPIPAAVDHATLASGRVLFVGDAAKATDPLTGEGIGQALLTGRLAATAVAGRGAAGPDAVGATYRRSVHAHLVTDHRMSGALSTILRSRLGARASVRIAGLTPWTRRNFARWLFEDEPRGVILTPRRWHRRFLARPGAFAAE